MIHTKYISVIQNQTHIRTVLPLQKNNFESNLKEFFKISSKKSEIVDKNNDFIIERKEFSSDILFEQEPTQIIKVLIPLLVNSQILRAINESYISELSSRIIATKTATENAKEIIIELNQKIYRARQAMITQELAEIIAGASCQE